LSIYSETSGFCGIVSSEAQKKIFEKKLRQQKQRNIRENMKIFRDDYYLALEVSPRLILHYNL
jgi:hypothetical protein